MTDYIFTCLVYYLVLSVILSHPKFCVCSFFYDIIVIIQKIDVPYKSQFQMPQTDIFYSIYTLLLDAVPQRFFVFFLFLFSYPKALHPDSNLSFPQEFCRSCPFSCPHLIPLDSQIQQVVSVTPQRRIHEISLPKYRSFRKSLQKNYVQYRR